jgi:hypothetical protein
MHMIEFLGEVECDVIPTGRDRLERVKMSAGDRLDCRVRCHVVRVQVDWFEVADIEYSEGRLLAVPCGTFKFLDTEQSNE